MTSFGGLYSYATGDPVPIPKLVHVASVIVVVVILVAFYRQNNLKQNK
jgi:hypothetical protein